MAKPSISDAVRETFAELTGAFEDLALIAAEAQAVRTVDEARQRCDALVAAIEHMVGCLRQLQESLR